MIINNPLNAPFTQSILLQCLASPGSK